MALYVSRQSDLIFTKLAVSTCLWLRLKIGNKACSDAEKALSKLSMIGCMVFICVRTGGDGLDWLDIRSLMISFSRT